MRNKHLIKQFMKENNLEVLKDFWVFHGDGDGNTVREDCYIDKDLNLLVRSYNTHNAFGEYFNATDNYDIDITWPSLLFSDDITIQNKPWKPLPHNWYYYVTYNDAGYDSTMWANALMDKLNYAIGNVFKTKEEAIKSQALIQERIERGRELFEPEKNRDYIQSREQ